MPGPVYSYQWWGRPQPRAIEWQQGRSLLLFAAAAVSPVGAAATERPPLRTPTPVAVGWQAAPNRVIQQAPSALPLGASSTSLPTQPGAGPALAFTGSGTPTPNVVTIASGAWTALPAPPIPFRPADVRGVIPTPQVVTIASGKSTALPPPPLAFRPADVYGIAIPAPAALPTAARWTEIPQRQAPFWPGENFRSALQFTVPTLRSAQFIDTPTLRVPFQQADVHPTAIPQLPSLKSGTSLDVPPRVPPFFAASVRNYILPPLEVFTRFPFRQQDWPLPIPPRSVEHNFSFVPNVGFFVPPLAGNMPSLIGLHWIQATTVLIRAGITPDNGLVFGNFVPVRYFDNWPVAINWVKSSGTPGFVTAQSPAAGSAVAFNDAITLTVTNYPMAVTDRYSAGGFQ